MRLSGQLPPTSAKAQKTGTYNDRKRVYSRIVSEELNSSYKSLVGSLMKMCSSIK